MRNPLRVFEKCKNKNVKDDFEIIKSIYFYDIFDIFVDISGITYPKKYYQCILNKPCFGTDWGYL